VVAIFILQIVRIYKLRLMDVLQRRNVETEFRENRSAGSEVELVDTHSVTHTETAECFDKVYFSLESRETNGTYSARVLHFDHTVCYVVQGCTYVCLHLSIIFSEFFFILSLDLEALKLR
jgi:hypothetical protein